MATVQLEGVTIFNSVTHSDDLTSLTLNLTRPVTQVPGTFADADGTQVLGSAIGQMTVTFNHDEGDTSGAWATFYSAYLSDSGAISFSARYKSGAQSATNPTYAGTVLVNDLDIGGQVGELKSQTKTWPVYGVTQATSTS
jgi:hypothetical protein